MGDFDMGMSDFDMGDFDDDFFDDGQRVYCVRRLGRFRDRRPVQKGPGHCPRCGSDTVLRSGKHGLFYGCTKYPVCRGSRQVEDPPADPYAGKDPVKEAERACGVPAVSGELVNKQQLINGLIQNLGGYTDFEEEVLDNVVKFIRQFKGEKQ
jgi:hypothetical protein